ncbi:hypothetical protein ACFE04_003663 [Oxalis oulophora]
MKNLLTLIQNRFNSTSSTAVQLQNSSSITIDYLINSCGLSSKSALSTSKKLNLDPTKIQKSKSVLQLLKSNGLDDTQITKLVERSPEILKCRVASNLKPKVDYFVENGWSGMHLAMLFMSNSDIIGRSLDGQIKPTFEFLKRLLGSNADVIKASIRCPWLLRSDLKNVLKPNVEFLIKEGFPISSVAKLIILNPRVLLLKPEYLARDFNAVKELGFHPKSLSFVHTLRVIAQLSESTLSKKVELFKSLGWKQEDILCMFAKNPFGFAYSEEKIRSGMDFLVNTVKVELDFVIARPTLINFGLDKMRRRYYILKVLESKNLFKWHDGVAILLTRTNEKTFLKRYIDRYKTKVPGLEAMYQSTAEI